MNKELTPLEIENELFHLGNVFPTEAVQAAIHQQASITPKLIDCLNHSIKNVSNLDDDDIGHLFAVFLLSQFREKSAFESIIRLARLPEFDIEYLIGDSITDDLHRFIASTYNGDFQAIKNLIEDTEVNVWSRIAGLESLIILVNENQLEMDEVGEYFLDLFTHSSFINNEHIFSYLVSSCCFLDPHRFKEEIQKAFDEQIVDTFVICEKYFKESLIQAKNDKTDKSHSLIEDTITELQDWDCFWGSDEADEEERTPIKPTPKIIPAPKMVSDSPKAGRNESCPCGSGKKYKKCCLNSGGQVF